MHTGGNDWPSEELRGIAFSVAHDLNNILSVVLGTISLVMGSCQDGDKPYQSLAKAEQAALKARDMAQQLIAFATSKKNIRRPCNVAKIINETAIIAAVRHQSPCELSVADNLWTIAGHPDQISQLLHNLIINPIQRNLMEGTIQIVANNVTLSKDNDLELKPGKYVKISGKYFKNRYLDNFSRNNRSPSGRPNSKSRGPGLSTVQLILDDIVKNHAGNLVLESSQEWSHFHLYLPGDGKKGDAKNKLVSKSAIGKGKILVMDDEEMIRNNVGMILEVLGYEPEFAENGDKALEMYLRAQEGRYPFDAVILDLTVLEGRGGREIIQGLLEMDPQAKAIVFSGFPDDPMVARFKEFGFSGAIKKPYTINDFSETLFNVLN